ncbi:ATP-binding protein [Sphingomonas edaphi]|uniref:ATP-binding protein n=1 Tax=Sphingomonas edaphi TaxID=2315689 RepID=UPI0013145AA1|nr:ATP-binding protein [Sphingomonas edaphi]
MAGTMTVALVLLLAMLQWRQFQSEASIRVAVQASNDRLAMIDGYLTILRDIENGQRGYMVTESEEFLEPFNLAIGRLKHSHEELQRFTGADATDAALTTQLLKTGAARAQRSSEIIRLLNAGNSAGAISLVREGYGKAMMDRARSLADQLTNREQVKLRQLVSGAASQRYAQQRAILLVELALLLAVFLMVVGLLRNVRQVEANSADMRDSAVRQAAIYEGATDAMMMLDQKGIIETANSAAERLFDRTRKSLVGQSNLVLFKEPPSQEVSAAYLDSLAKGAPSSLGKRDFIGLRGDGTDIEVEVVTTPIQLEDGLHYLAVARDATERRRTERLKSEFVATVSHELRTPLTSIAGSLGLLSGGAAGEMPPKALRLVKIAHDNSERLIRLINDILDIEKIESGKLHFDLRPVKLCKILSDVVQANHAYAERHEVGLVEEPCPTDWEIHADHDRLMQVFTNLVSNAVKFSPKGADVVISARKIDDSAIISVVDKGDGIPEEFKSRIFSKFSQADSTDARQKGGTGLGLSIVRELVFRMGGEVRFDSRKGEGTVFNVEFPLVSSFDAVAQSTLKLERLSEADLPSVLHVDDDPDMLRLIASAFEGKATMHSTPSVREAEAALQRFEFDGVILDIGMNDGNGLDLIPLIRKTNDEAPIILFTARDEEAMTDVPVDACLTKSKSDLDTLVRVTLERVQQKEV